ncbi:DUF2442 domain-containing protein [methane-oxidizing endosymbiont of Gigantopelta aegis]|uniref:DUF2442 domain-containing protein n=1 Tax=methane-oxidizing endosymbiont of Gigantopelta aegis TaxID=2794938 RepID=UPI0018DB148C|nr:DUF2442 domain-containing protein [methane-oxidizing endosymbiont of Gigantopelta aegis]
MNTLAIKQHPQALNVQYTDESLVVELVDGRTISVPLVWFPRLAHASKKQLRNWELLGDGEGIHWPDIDEDISVHGLLLGTQSTQKTTDVSFDGFRCRSIHSTD